MLKQYLITPNTHGFLSQLSKASNIYPIDHIKYLEYLKTQGVYPKVIYDIGAAVKHWTTAARTVWPDSAYYLFDAIRAVEFLYQDENYHIGVLSDSEKYVKFYEHPLNPGGNSLYKENKAYNRLAEVIYTEHFIHQRKAERLDAVVSRRNFPSPDFIKLDVQGAELEILRGSGNLLNTVEHIILELPKVEYNIGAPRADEVIAGLDQLGFRMIESYFCENDIDGDCHFIRK